MELFIPFNLTSLSEILDLCKDKEVELTKKQVTVTEAEVEDALDLVVKHLPTDLTILKTLKAGTIFLRRKLL